MNATPESIESQLEEAAENLPGPYKPDSKTWGQSFAHQLLLEATPEMCERIGQVFDRFLERGTVNQAVLAATTYPERAGALRGIQAGLERADLPDEAHEALVSALGRAIESEQLPWDPAYRELIGSGARCSLLSGALVYDYEWFMANLTDVLDEKPGDAATALWFAVQPLRAAEAETLRSELEGREDELGSTWVKRLLKVIDREEKAGRFAERTGPSRF